MIRFDQVSKRYEGGHEALSQLTFEVAKGEMAFVTGHSGAGKSTLLKLLALIERPSHGHISLDGQSLAKIGHSGIPKLRRSLGMVFQDHRLLMDRTVFANVELPLVIGGIAPWSVADACALRWKRSACSITNVSFPHRYLRANNSASALRAQSSPSRAC